MAVESLASTMPDSEAERLAALRQLGIVGTEPEAHFDALCRTAQNLFSAPIALVALIEQHEQWFKATCGLDLQGTSRDLSFCAHAIESDEIMVVEDATRDPRFSANPLVTGAPSIRFYAGAPLILGPGMRVGAICIIDTVPRTFSAEQAAELADLATIAVAYLRLHEAKLANQSEVERRRASEARLADRNRELQVREQGLREANEFLSLAEQLARTGHWRFDVSERTINSSSGYEAIFGRHPAPRRFTFKEHLPFVHPDDRERAVRKMEMLNAGEAESYENIGRIVRADGEVRVISSCAVAKRDETGRVVSVFGVNMDVTEAAQLEQKLRADAEQLRANEVLLARRNQELGLREQGLRNANELLSLAEEFAHVGHWRVDVGSGFVHSSAGFERIFGREPLPGRFHTSDHTAVIHPGDRERTRRKMDDVDAGLAEGYENRARILRPNGETRVVVSRARAERDETGRVVSVFGVCMDVTEAAHADEELRAKTAILASTLENMDQGIVVAGADGRVTLINRRGIELLGLPREWLVDMPSVVDMIEFQERRGEGGKMRSVIEGYAAADDVFSKRHSYERVRPNGTVLDVLTLPLPDGSIIATFTDVTARRAAERAIQESEAQFRVLAESASDMIVRRRADGAVLYISPASFEMLGYTPAELIELSFEDMYHPDDRAEPLRVMQAMIAGRQDQGHLTYRLRHRDGRWIWMESSSRIVRATDGTPTELISAVRDVSERVAVDARLRYSEERLALVLDSGSDGVWDWNVTTGDIWRSGRCWDLLRLEYRADATFERIMRHIIHADDQAHAQAVLAECFRQERSAFETEFRFMVADGGFIWVLARGRVVERSPDGSPTRLVGTLLNITARKEAEDRIAHMARHDSLTDLPNRAQFRDQLGQRLAEVERNGGTLAVLCLDLDRFKAVNDTLGHPAGDAVLREIAQRLRQSVRAEDTVARLGGDEFAVLVANANPAQLRRIDTLAACIIETVNEPIVVEGHEISVGLTVGVAVAPGDGLEADALFKRADLALYRAKAEGRNTFRFFETGMDEALAERRRLELDLRGAVARSELELHYQPVLDTRTGSFSGFEALLRWRHPERGLVSPADFVPIAEETGLIVPIGEWVLRTACREAAAWGNPALKVSVNVSAVQFRHGLLVESIASALDESGLSPRRLEIEITESVLIDTGDDVLTTVQRIRGMGIGVALDDFGTGYSSLSYLHRFPFDRVKIDRSFVKEIASSRTAAIVRATVDLAHRLGMAVTAEGIETAEQLGLVRAEGCTEIQGYLISRPMSAPDARVMAGHGRGEQAA